MVSTVLQASIVRSKMRLGLKYRKEQRDCSEKLLSHCFSEVVLTPYPVLHMEPQHVQY